MCVCAHIHADVEIGGVWGEFMFCRRILRMSKQVLFVPESVYVGWALASWRSSPCSKNKRPLGGAGARLMLCESKEQENGREKKEKLEFVLDKRCSIHLGFRAGFAHIQHIPKHTPFIWYPLLEMGASCQRCPLCFTHRKCQGRRAGGPRWIRGGGFGEPCEGGLQWNVIKQNGWNYKTCVWFLSHWWLRFNIITFTNESASFLGWFKVLVHQS